MLQVSTVPITAQEEDADAMNDISTEMYPFRYPVPPSDVVEFYRTYFGPTIRAFAAAHTPERQSLFESHRQRRWFP